MTLDFSRCRSVQLLDGSWSHVKDHVKIGVETLIKNPYLLLGDEMGLMKSAQTIIAAQILFEMDKLDRVLVIAPASVRGVWFDPELGELARHLWFDIPSTITEFHTKIRGWQWKPKLSGKRLHWIVTNYEYVRSQIHLDELLPYCNERTLIVLDESTAVKNHKSAQYLACETLRWLCGRVLLLNGTPIAHSPNDMFAQGNILHPRILQCKYITHFKARYNILEPILGKGGKPLLDPRGRPLQKIEGHKNLEDLQNRFKPYVLRRLKRDCTDLPPVLPSITFGITLTEKTWRAYKAMRDDMVAWLSDSDVSVAQQAAIKSLRLSQITSGFLGGVEDGLIADDPIDDDLLDQIQIPGVVSVPLNDRFNWPTSKPVDRPTPTPVQSISTEKQEFLLQWFFERLEEDPKLKLVVWCRFKFELDRLMKNAIAAFDVKRINVACGSISGGQPKKERENSLRLLDPRTSPDCPVFFAGTFGTGSLGLNFTAAHTVIHLSTDFSFYKYQQALARVDRPGQLHPVSVFDVIAEGPKGQKTIDHKIVAARAQREDVATWTTSAWIKALTEE